MAKQEPTDEELINNMASYNERSPNRWRSQFELHRRAAEKAGRSTHIWTIVGAWAAIIAAIVAIVTLIAQWPR